MKSFDLFHMIDGRWEPSFQIHAGSRRQAMVILRREPAYSQHDRHVRIGDEDVTFHGGPMHGRYKVRLAA